MNKLIILFTSMIAAVFVISCGGEESSVSTTQPEMPALIETPTVIIQEKEEIPFIPVPTSQPVKPSVAPVDTPTPQVVEKKKIPNIFDKYEFILTLDEDTDIWNSNLTTSGLLEETPDINQGLITFEYKGVDASLIWSPNEGESNQDLVDFGYFILSDSQPENIFTLLNNGDLTVGTSSGNFAAFVVSDAQGSDAGGGLIAGWTCLNNTSYTLVTTGPDSTALQIRFNNIVSGFSCE
ncbi:MAG: hypothetical protein ACJ0BE_05635 [Dehalococcoidia bacterium]